MTGKDAVDDSTIADSVPLWRKISPMFLVPDSSGEHLRVSSGAFQNYRDSSGLRHNAFSVCISSDAENEGVGPSDIVEGMHGYAVAAFSAGLARELEQAVSRVPQEGEVAHGHVTGRKSCSVRKKLAKNATLVFRP